MEKSCSHCMCTLKCRGKMDQFFSVCGWCWATVGPTEFFCALNALFDSIEIWLHIFLFIQVTVMSKALHQDGQPTPMRAYIQHWSGSMSESARLVCSKNSCLRGVNLLGISITMHRSRIRTLRLRFSQSRDHLHPYAGKNVPGPGASECLRRRKKAK